jgi:hypothetical protein
MTETKPEIERQKETLRVSNLSASNALESAFLLVTTRMNTL